MMLMKRERRLEGEGGGGRERGPGGADRKGLSANPKGSGGAMTRQRIQRVQADLLSRKNGHVDVSTLPGI